MYVCTTYYVLQYRRRHKNARARGREGARIHVTPTLESTREYNNYSISKMGTVGILPRRKKGGKRPDYSW